jgi:hypothetical protein
MTAFFGGWWWLWVGTVRGFCFFLNSTTSFTGDHSFFHDEFERAFEFVEARLWYRELHLPCFHTISINSMINISITNASPPSLTFYKQV